MMGALSVHSDPKKASKNSKSNKRKGRNKTSPNKDGDVVLQVPPSGQIATSNLKEFTLNELKTATRHFNVLLGERGLGELFLGWIDEKTYAPSMVGVGMAIAVKKFDLRVFQQHSGWQIQLQLLGKLCHPNLTSIWGYCIGNREVFIVYKYMYNKSLESHLFEEDAEPLPWFKRLKIAIGAARGLAFLHTTVKEAICRQFQTSNILLDWDFNATLWNFEIAKLDAAVATCYSPFSTCIPTFITRDMGGYFYTDPEYWTTGSLTMKSDVYGFGLVLLELLTGLPTFDGHSFSISKYFVMNTERHLIFDERRLKRLMDQRRNGDYPLKGALQYVVLVQKCLDFQSINRPTMEEVLESLEHINRIKMDPNGNSAPVDLESVDLEGDDWSNTWEDSLSVGMPRYVEVEGSPNSYLRGRDMELSGPR